MLFYQHSYYHLVTAEPPFICTRIGICTKQDIGQEYSMLSSVTTHSSFAKSVMMSVAVSEVGVVIFLSLK